MLKNIQLPEEVTKTYFNCFEQQIMTLCYFYHKEFWKLFLNQHFEFSENEITYIEDTLEYKNPLLDNAKKYYGLSLIRQENLYDIMFEKKEIYLAYLDTKYYPHTVDIDEEGIHCVIIYNQKDNGYIMNDNYYGETEFYLEKGLYEKGIKKLFVVKFNEIAKVEEDNFDLFIETFSYSAYGEIKQSYQYIINNNIMSYQSADLINLISKISCFIKKDCVMVQKWQMDDRYLEKCSFIIDDFAGKVRKVFLAVLKAHLKYGTIPEQIMKQKLERIMVIVKSEEVVKQEIIAILLKKVSIRDSLNQQVMNYLKIDKFDENESVYDMHDKLSVLYLINYFEKSNQLPELDYDDFAKCDSYLDFELKIYEKIFVKEVEKNKNDALKSYLFYNNYRKEDAL